MKCYLPTDELMNGNDYITSISLPLSIPLCSFHLSTLCVFRNQAQVTTTHCRKHYSDLETRYTVLLLTFSCKSVKFVHSHDLYVLHKVC